MSAPIKNYCDYFSHDRDMRNHRKIKAIRNKFGITGYAIWVMILEYLTGIDGNVFEYSDTEFELMGGDFGVPAAEIRRLTDYCVSLELLFLKDGFINSESLDERLSHVYQKRGREKDKSKKQYRDNGKFAKDNTVSHGDSAAEKPQRKGKESKVKEREVGNGSLAGNTSTYDAESFVLGNQIQLERICLSVACDMEYAKKSLRKFHLFLQENNRYPQSSKSIFNGFEKWLMNEKTFDDKKIKPENEYEKKRQEALKNYKSSKL